MGIPFFLFTIVALMSIQLVMSVMFIIMMDLPLDDIGVHNTMSMEPLSRVSTYIAIGKMSVWVGIYSLIGAIAYRYSHQPKLVRGDRMSAASEDEWEQSADQTP